MKGRVRGVLYSDRRLDILPFFCIFNLLLILDWPVKFLECLLFFDSNGNDMNLVIWKRKKKQKMPLSFHWTKDFRKKGYFEKKFIRERDRSERSKRKPFTKCQINEINTLNLWNFKKLIDFKFSLYNGNGKNLNKEEKNRILWTFPALLLWLWQSLGQR